MEDPLKVLQALPNLMFLLLHDGYRGEQLHIEGGFQKLKHLGLRNLGGLNRLIIDEGALPLLEKLVIAECPQLKEVPSGIQHMKSLKPNSFLVCNQMKALILGKSSMFSYATFLYRTRGVYYDVYKLGKSELLERRQS